MGKLLLLLLLVIVAAFVWRKLGVRASGRRSAAPAERAAEQMVACEHCGLHVPSSEAVREGEHAYCCAEHRRRAGR